MHTYLILKLFNILGTRNNNCLSVSVCIKTVQPLRILAKTAAALKIATDCDLSFLKSIIKDQNSPEYSGFNTKLARESGRGMQNATIVMYLPLIDKPPTDYSTMMTALVEAIRLTKY